MSFKVSCDRYCKVLTFGFATNGALAVGAEMQGRPQMLVFCLKGSHLAFKTENQSLPGVLQDEISRILLAFRCNLRSVSLRSPSLRSVSFESSSPSPRTSRCSAFHSRLTVLAKRRRPTSVTKVPLCYPLGDHPPRHSIITQSLDLPSA